MLDTYDIQASEDDVLEAQSRLDYLLRRQERGVSVSDSEIAEARRALKIARAYHRQLLAEMRRAY